MSAPTKAEILEEYAESIGMTELELIAYCKETLEDKNFTVRENLDPNAQMTDYQRFRYDMFEAGFKVTDYRGRNRWKGPAVYTNDNFGMQDVVRATNIRLQSDNMGKHYVVYPAAHEESW